MPVLYASGYNQEIVIARGVLEPGISYLPKPYSSEQVLRRIREHVKPAMDTSEGGVGPGPRQNCHNPRTGGVRPR